MTKKRLGQLIQKTTYYFSILFLFVWGCIYFLGGLSSSLKYPGMTGYLLDGLLLITAAIYMLWHQKPLVKNISLVIIALLVLPSSYIAYQYISQTGFAGFYDFLPALSSLLIYIHALVLMGRFPNVFSHDKTAI